MALLTTLLLLVFGYTAAPVQAAVQGGPQAEAMSAVHSCCNQQRVECARSCAAQPPAVFSPQQPIWRSGPLLPVPYKVTATRPGYTTQPTRPPRA